MSVAQLDVFQVIADGSRREILQMLSQNPLTVNEIAANFDMSRPAVSKHLKIMQQSGFVNIQNSGRLRICYIKQEGFEVLKSWLNYYDEFWQNRLANLEKLMNNNEP